MLEKKRSPFSLGCWGMRRVSMGPLKSLVVALKCCTRKYSVGQGGSPGQSEGRGALTVVSGSRMVTRPYSRPVIWKGSKLVCSTGRPCSITSSTWGVKSRTVTSSLGRAPARDCSGPTCLCPFSRTGTRLPLARNFSAWALKVMSRVTVAR